jgi:hypothetical protein
MTCMANALNLGNQRIISQSWRSAWQFVSATTIVICWNSPTLETFVQLLWHHFPQSFTQHSTSFCSCSTKSDTKFHTSSLFLYGHVPMQQNKSHTMTQMIVTLKNIIKAVWYKLLHVGYSHICQPFHVHMIGGAPYVHSGNFLNKSQMNDKWLMKIFIAVFGMLECVLVEMTQMVLVCRRVLNPIIVCHWN